MMQPPSHPALWAVVLAASILVSVSLPHAAEAGVFIGLRQDRVDLTRDEQPTLVISFDEKLFRASVRVVADAGGFERTWAFKSVVAGREHLLQWRQPAGLMGYSVTVEMVRAGGEHEIEETWIEVAATRPLTASIPGESVDMASRSFDLVTNHPPTHVDLEVLGDDQKLMGSSTFQATAAVRGKPLRVTWSEDRAANVFRVTARAHDEFGFWAEVEIIPWSLTIDHENVNFETGSDVISEVEKPKLDAPWKQIRDAVETYGQWVRCSLYVGGYTDTVGDAKSNKALSERRALALARHFAARGATFPIYYRGYGESVQAVSTPDSTDEVRNRRALYVVTAGSPPRGGDTPPGAWKKLR